MPEYPQLQLKVLLHVQFREIFVESFCGDFHGFVARNLVVVFVEVFVFAAPTGSHGYACFFPRSGNLVADAAVSEKGFCCAVAVSARSDVVQKATVAGNFIVSAARDCFELFVGECFELRVDFLDVFFACCHFINLRI